MSLDDALLKYFRLQKAWARVRFSGDEQCKQIIMIFNKNSKEEQKTFRFQKKENQKLWKCEEDSRKNMISGGQRVMSRCAKTFKVKNSIFAFTSSTYTSKILLTSVLNDFALRCKISSEWLIKVPEYQWILIISAIGVVRQVFCDWNHLSRGSIEN